MCIVDVHDCLAGMLCILLWSFCVYKEYRSIWLMLEAVSQIPKAKRTDFRDNSFRAMSKGAGSVLKEALLSLSKGVRIDDFSA